MLLDIIIIVLRETLEASILIAVLLSVSCVQGMTIVWVPVALLLGLAGAVVYAHYLDVISLWFDYAGQEYVNAGLQLLIYSLICVLVPLRGRTSEISERLMYGLMLSIVVLALVREGGELLVFYSSFLQKEGVILSSLTSGFVGLAVGVSVGILVYYSLVIGTDARARVLQSVVLSLVAAGMVLQATQLLIQVDWLAAGDSVWDSNWLIAESSMLGQIVYAIFGYEATPSLVEVGVYGLSILGVITVATVSNRFGGPNDRRSKGNEI